MSRPLTDVGANPGRVALDMMNLGNPGIGWVKLAEAMGVEAARAATAKRFADVFAQASQQVVGAASD